MCGMIDNEGVMNDCEDKKSRTVLEFDLEKYNVGKCYSLAK